jgi:Fe-S cluster assembly iron-binding protein IscA
MAISITPRATRRLAQIMLKDKNPHLCLRVTVESGGCHGFQYLMSLVDASKVDESEDVLFVASSSADPSIASGGEGSGEWRRVAEGRPKVVIDESSLELLQGSRVDYTMELIGSQFKIDNPRASSSCGCGTSFDVKI